MESAESWPIFEEDLFSDESLANSQANFKKLRELGEAVWVPSIDMFVVARYDDVARCRSRQRQAHQRLGRVNQ